MGVVVVKSVDSFTLLLLFINPNVSYPSGIADQLMHYWAEIDPRQYIIFFNHKTFNKNVLNASLNLFLMYYYYQSQQNVLH